MNNADDSILKRRLLLGFCAAAAVLVSAGAAYHAHHRETLRADAERLLLATAQIKLSQLNAWREERLTDALLLTDSPIIASYAADLAAGRGGAKAAEMLERRLSSYIKHKRYHYAALADRDGAILAYTGARPEVDCPQLRELTGEALASGGPVMGEFQLSHEKDLPHLDIVQAVSRGPAGRELFLLLRVHPGDFMYPLLKEWSAEGNTGEILLVERRDGDILFLNDLRHLPDAAMRLTRPISDEELPAALALKGFEGIVRGRDYRGVEVLAAVAPVRGTQWALVAKLDWAEVMEDSGMVGLLLALLIAALLAAGGAGTYALIKKQEEKHGREKALMSGQRQLALDAAGMGWWRYDPASRMSYYDERYKLIFEVTGSSMPNDEILKRIHPDDLPGVWAKVEAALDPAKREPYSAEYRVVVPDKGTKWVEARGLAIFEEKNGEKRAAEFVGTVLDITERKTVQLEIEKLNRSLVEKNREMEKFLYIASHDLRGPLVNIQGFGQNLLERLTLVREKALAGDACDPELKALLAEKIPRDLGFIAESAAKMDRLITALLRVSRLGRAVPRPEKLDVNALLDRTLSHISFRAETEGAGIKRGELPPCFADRESVEQIFANLLENAIKHRHPDRKPLIEVTGRLEGGRAVYEVRDNGAGISPAEKR
jgi:PAS domain-containing protein